MVIFREFITKVNITWTAILNHLWEDRKIDDWNFIFKDNALKPNWGEIEEHMLKRNILYESHKPFHRSSFPASAMTLAPRAISYRQEIRPLRDIEILRECNEIEHSDPDVRRVLKCYLHSWLIIAPMKLRFQKR